MKLDNKLTMIMLMGTFEVNQVVGLEDICIPEMDKNKTIIKQVAYVFQGSCAYDVILDRDFLKTAKMILDFKNCMIEWMDCKIPMLTHADRMHVSVHSVEDALLNQEDEEAEIDELSDLYISPIKDAKYEEKDTDKMCQELQYLTHQEQNE